MFALATHKGRLVLVLSCVLGSGDTSKAGKRSMSQLRDRLLIESAERILGSTFVYMHGCACTCVSMGVHACVQVWVCMHMCMYGCACPWARALRWRPDVSHGMASLGSSPPGFWRQGLLLASNGLKLPADKLSSSPGSICLRLTSSRSANSCHCAQMMFLHRH